MGKIIRAMILMVVFILPLGGPGISKTSAATGNWLGPWANRIQLTIDHEKIDYTLADLPVLIYLSPSSGIDAADVSFIFSTLGSDENRKKIAITSADGVSQLYIEIEKWDTENEQAWLWVKVPFIFYTVDTVLYLYYDPAQTDNINYAGDTGSTPAEKVWDGNFVMVQHLEQDDDTEIYQDSTSRHHDGTGTDYRSGGTSPFQVPSILADGQCFDIGAGTYIEIPDSDDFSISTTGQITISLWVSPAVFNFSNTDGEYVNFMGKGDRGQHEWSFVFYDKDETEANEDGTDRSQRISFYIYNLEGGYGAGSYTNEPIAIDEWVYITAKVDSRYIYMYRNGELVDFDPYTGPQAYAQVYPRNGTEPVRIGTRNQTSWFEGRMDEVRISDVARSDSWIRASYFSDLDNLLSFGEANERLEIPVESTKVPGEKTLTVDSEPQPSSTEDTPPVSRTTQVLIIAGIIVALLAVVAGSIRWRHRR